MNGYRRIQVKIKTWDFLILVINSLLAQLQCLARQPATVARILNMNENGIKESFMRSVIGAQLFNDVLHQLYMMFLNQSVKMWTYVLLIIVLKALSMPNSETPGRGNQVLKIIP